MITYRSICTSDAATVAGIHAASWRTAYRGILLSDYLDHAIDADRHGHWQRCLATVMERDIGVLAHQNDVPVGFLFAARDGDARWGSLLDNLHVLPEYQGLSVGAGLLRALVARLQHDDSSAGSTPLGLRSQWTRQRVLRKLRRRALACRGRRHVRRRQRGRVRLRLA